MTSHVAFFMPGFSDRLHICIDNIICSEFVMRQSLAVRLCPWGREQVREHGCGRFRTKRTMNDARNDG